MARVERESAIERRTLVFELPNGLPAQVEIRMGPTRAWYDSEESKDDSWHPTEGDGPGRVLALRLTV